MLSVAAESQGAVLQQETGVAIDNAGHDATVV